MKSVRHSSLADETKFRPHYQAIMLRGGRMTKHKGQVASYAPMLGTVLAGVSALALGAVMQLGNVTPAFAGDCVADPNASGSFICSGAADPANDMPVVIDSNAAVDVETQAGFGLDVNLPVGAPSVPSTVSITGVGRTTFTDTNESLIRGFGGYDPIVTGISINNNNDATNTVTDPGLRLDINGPVFGERYAVQATNNGAGALEITADLARTVQGFSGRNSIQANNEALGTDLTISTSGSLYGIRTAIDANNRGSGALTIINAATIETNAYPGTPVSGIFASNSERGTDLSVSSTNSVQGVSYGIDAINSGTGTLTLNVTDVTATTGDGIFAFQGGIGSGLSLTSTGLVQGGASGITARNQGLGGGNLTLNVADVTGTNGNGIFAENGLNGVDLSLSATGAVQGGDYGIDVQNDGTGALRINVADVTGNSSDGINATNFTSGTDLSIVSTGTVQGNTDGIEADNEGSGALTIEAADVIGTNGFGIAALNRASGTNLEITATGMLQGGLGGIDAENDGSGALTIMAIDVIADNGGALGNGIRADNGVNGTDLAITTTGIVRGNSNGIEAENNGTGALTINVADVTGNNQNGIEASNSGAGMYLTISATGTIQGDDNGISVDNLGDGALTINVADVTGTNLDGIDAYNGFAGTDLSITATGVVRGGREGIDATNDGIGALIINAVDVTGENGLGLAAYNGIYGANLEVTTTGTVQGAQDGIQLTNEGSGALILNAADVTGTNSDGIDVYNGVGGTALSVTATGTVQGNVDGVRAFNSGNGALSVSVADVSGRTSDGIEATNNSSGTDLRISSTGSVQGGSVGILATNNGSGELYIDVVDVNGGTGIEVSNNSGATDLTIVSTGTIYGNGYGVFATNSGTGALTLDLHNVQTDTNGGVEGIQVTNSAAGTDLSISATGQIQSLARGVYADNNGTGALTVNVSEVRSYGLEAIEVTNSVNGTDLSITATGPLQGTTGGIDADNLGSGALRINVADVTTTTGAGIYADNSALGTDLTISSTGLVQGLVYGIRADNSGSGQLEINVADVTGVGSLSSGIQAYTRAGGTDLSITATGTVQGGFTGITAENEGSGALTLNVAEVRGGLSDAIAAINSTTGTDLSITATGLVQGDDGIRAENSGSGATTINVTDVTGTRNSGILATNGTASTDLSITATGLVQGQPYGISANNQGTGTLTIDVNNATGTAGDGIFARNTTTGTGIRITSTGIIEGTDDGLVVLNNGTGDLTLDLANVFGDGDDGIFANNGVQGNNISITATGSIQGVDTGINVQNDGTGALSVDVVDVSGGASQAIYALNTSSGTDLTISASGTAAGSSDGIFARNNGSGVLTIEAGSVLSTAGDGIEARNTTAGNGVSITSTGVVQGADIGINAANRGAGDLNINASIVAANNGNAINAENGPNGVDLNITTTGIVTTNGDVGIYADNEGSGVLSINTASVYGVSRGIDARNSTEGTDLTISSTGTVRGNTGIYAENYGTGALTVDVADVTGTAGYGIVAYNSASTTDLEITATGTVDGTGNGIDADSFGSGELIINAVNVTGTNNDGINAYIGATGTDLSITTTGTVQGTEGIDAESRGSGSLTINAMDVVATSGAGIRTVTETNNTDLNITATGTIQSSAAGILAEHAGTGTLSIDVASITSTNNFAINANTFSGSTDLNITASGAIQGGDGAINAGHSGTGALRINVADVTTSLNTGITASASGTTTGLEITSSGTVTGAGGGISVSNSGAGALTLDVVNVSSGSVNDGILARNQGNGTDLSITATNSVETGGRYGINARNDGSGALTINVADVTGGSSAGILADNSAVGTDLSITATGAVQGGTDGINATNNGSGALMIDVAAVNGSSDTGIRAMAGTASTGLSITASGDVTGGVTGIYADHDGTGTLSIDTGNVTGTVGFGIFADTTTSSTDLSITSDGIIQADFFAVDADHRGTGDLSINVADVSSGYSGILADGFESVNNVSVTSTGTTSGDVVGIAATNIGNGNLEITANNVISNSGNGIFAYTGVNTSDLQITTTGEVRSDVRGISAEHTGTGQIRITAADITSQRDFGIYAQNSANGQGISIDTTAGTVTASREAVLIANLGTGALEINVADVTSTGTIAIDATNNANGTDLSITSIGTVQGDDDGIIASNDGSGALTIDVANVTGTNETGITAVNSSASTDLSITATGTVQGSTRGIDAENEGSGALTIDVADVTGTNVVGITAVNRVNATDLQITASGTVQGYDQAVDARHYGSGALSIDVANAIGSGIIGVGIYAYSNGTDLSVTSSGTVQGEDYGIRARDAGTGTLSIDVVDVTSRANDAIYAINEGSGVDLTISSTGTIQGSADGIVAEHYGSGALTINAADVTGTNGNGITAESRAEGTDLSIMATGLVEGGANGIVATNDGSGALNIEVADVTGGSSTGILVGNSVTGTDLSISSTALVQGATVGIDADHSGTGVLTIDVAEVTGANGDGINAQSGSAGTGLGITASGLVQGSEDGINAFNNGSGALNIDVADVTGGSSTGILVGNSVAGTDLSISSTALVQGATVGIDADHSGTGVLTIDVAEVTGANGDGINAQSGSAGTGLGITASGLVQGSEDGINAFNNGSGALNIVAADVIGATGNGVSAYINSVGASLSVTSTGSIQGQGSGILAENGSSGDLNIDVTDVTGATLAGIDANGGVGSAGVSITSSGTILGATDGIDANGGGSGALAIDVADVTGTGGTGISAVNSGAGTSLSIASTGLVQGDTSGLVAENSGSGALTINVTDVTSGTETGIDATNSDAGTDLSITATGVIQGGDNGIIAENNGNGALTIDVAQVSMARYDAIVAVNGAGGTDLNITARGSVESGYSGIRGINSGSGALSINVADVAGGIETGITATNGLTGTDLSVTATGLVQGGSAGINAQNNGTGALVINAADVSGGQSAIVADHRGAGDILVNVSGDVTSQSEAAIVTSSAAGRLTQITATAGASVSSASGTAITNGDSNSQVTFQAGSTLGGSVLLGAGSDTLSLQGPNVLAPSLPSGFTLDGGDDTDTLSFAGVEAAFDLANVINWENLIVTDQSDLTLTQGPDAFGADSLTLSDSRVSLLSSTSQPGTLRIGSGGFANTLQASGTATINSSVENTGVISLANGATGDQLVIAGDLSGAGTIVLDLGDTVNDSLAVAGDTAGSAQQLFLQRVSSGGDQALVYRLVDVDGAATASDFEIANPDLVLATGENATVQGVNVLTLEFDEAEGAFNLTAFDSQGQQRFVPDAVLYGAVLQALSDQLRLGSARQRLLQSVRQSGNAEPQTASRDLFETIGIEGANVWFNVSGGRDDYDLEGRDVDTSYGRLEIGGSIELFELGNGLFIGGLGFGVTDLSASIQTSVGSASSDSTGYDLTLSGLWLADSQFYIDSQFRYAWFDNSLNLLDGSDVDVDGQGYAVSVEFGKSFDLPSANARLVPQAQLIYSDASLDDADLGGGLATGSDSDGDALIGRLGLRYERDLRQGGLLYAEADYFHSFDNETAASFGGSELLTERSRNRGEITLGGSLQVSKRGRLFGEISASEGFGQADNDFGISGQFGFSVQF